MIRPKLNTLDEPLIEVMELDKSPPVQDSANETLSFFDKNFKNSFGVIMDDICAGFYVVLTLVCFMIIKIYVL